MNKFAKQLLRWHEVNGRHDLPWQINPDPYRVWISEIMLQQTQVNTVIPYYHRFINTFPDLQSLAQANINEVLHLWSGLGYYARARNLYKSATLINAQYDGNFPVTLDDLIALPGIGRSTAGAILTLACNQRFPILDGNVKRVLTRYFAISGWPGQGKVEKELWLLADELTPFKHVSAYTQAIMDLGATVCKRKNPDCLLCPVNKDCQAYVHGEQNKYPLPKPVKSLPVRKVFFLILINQDGRYLLKQNPDDGIWGGLWCFPGFREKSEMNHWLSDNPGYSVNIMTSLQCFRHTFSHYHLDITPVIGRAMGSYNNIAEQGDVCWYTPEDKLKLGLPAPVNKIIRQLDSTSLETEYGTNNTLLKTG